MITLNNLVGRSILVTVISTIDFFCLIGSYGLLRLLHISVNWITWIIATFLIVVSALFCLSLVAPIGVSADIGTSNLLGVIAFLIAIDSWSQWIMRRSYLVFKKGALPWLTQRVRNAFFSCASSISFWAGWS